MGKNMWGRDAIMGASNFIDRMTKTIIDPDIVNKSIDRTKTIPTKWHVDDIFTLSLGDNIYLMYRAISQTDQHGDNKTISEYKVNDSKFVYIAPDNSFEVISSIDEDKIHERPHEFMLAISKIFVEYIENKTYLLHYQSKNNTVQRFCKWCIRKKREENE